MRKNKLAGHIKFVGFDSSVELISALEKNEINGLVVQNPFRMGYQGVHTVLEATRDGQVSERIDTGVQLLTRDNLNDPEILQLLGE